MLQHLLGESQTKIGLLVFRIVGNARLGIRDGEAVVFELDVSEGSIGVIDGELAFGDARALGKSKLYCFSVAVNCLLELVVFELVIPLLFVLFALRKVVNH